MTDELGTFVYRGYAGPHRQVCRAVIGQNWAEELQLPVGSFLDFG